MLTMANWLMKIYEQRSKTELQKPLTHATENVQILTAIDEFLVQQMLTIHDPTDCSDFL